MGWNSSFLLFKIMEVGEFATLPWEGKWTFCVNPGGGKGWWAYTWVQMEYAVRIRQCDLGMVSRKGRGRRRRLLRLTAVVCQCGARCIVGSHSIVALGRILQSRF